MLSQPANLRERNTGTLLYSKPGAGLTLLREQILGPEHPLTLATNNNIAYWAKEFHVTGDQLHEAIRTHGTHVEKVRAALHSHATT